MARHLAQYRLADGSLSSSRSDAQLVDEQTIAQLAGQYSDLLPPGFTVGIASNETGSRGDSQPASNEIDTDFNDDGSERLTTYGLCQVSLSEAVKAIKLSAALDPAAALTDPDTNVEVFVGKARGELGDILDAAGIDPAAGIPRDVWPYLAWAHNAGVGEPVTSIGKFGLDWTALKARPQNAYMTERLIPYAERVLAAVDRFPTPGPGDKQMNTGARQLLVLLLFFVVFYALSKGVA